MLWAVWLIVAGVMAAVEALSLGLITVWFVMGALAAFLAVLAGASLAIQIGVFLVVSLLCLALLRPLALKHRNTGPSAEPTLVGATAQVIDPIDNQSQTGRVQTPGHMSWAARSADGSNIPAGATVRVVGQESIKLIVERMES